MGKLLQIKPLIILVCIITLFKVIYAWNTELFIDELMVLSRGYWDLESIFGYSLYHSFHPPLTYLVTKILVSLDIITINKMRFFSILFSTLPLLYFLINSKRALLDKYLFFYILFNAYIFSFSLIITNYILAFSLLLIFLSKYVRNHSVKPLLWLSCLIFFVNYLAGFICLVLIALKSFHDKEYKDLHHFAIFNIAYLYFIGIQFTLEQHFTPYFPIHQFTLFFVYFLFSKQKFSFKEFTRVILAFTILVLFQLNSHSSENYVLISGLLLYLLMWVFEHKELAIKYLPIQLIIFWVSQKIIFNFTRYNKITDFYLGAPEHSVPFEKVSPYLILVSLILILGFILRDKLSQIFKENKSFLSIVLTIVVFTAVMIFFKVTGRTIYMRYNFFLIALLIFVLSLLTSYIKEQKILNSILPVYLLANLAFSPSELTYFNTHKSSDLFEKVTKATNYSNEIYLFTSNYSWHEYFFRDYRINKNFNLFTLPNCSEENINKVMKMAGRNAYITSYEFECPNLKTDIMQKCSKYNSKCYDLGAQDATVILKIFEPDSQPNKIKHLDSLNYESNP